MTPMTIKTGIMAALALIGTTISNFLGGWDAAMQTLIIIMAVDYITGVLIAAIWKKSPKTESGALDSKAGFKGLCKKILILFAVLIAVQLDIVLSLPGIIRTAVILFFIGNEGLSVIENFGIMGVPLPAVVKKMFEQLRNKAEETTVEDTNDVEKKE